MCIRDRSETDDLTIYHPMNSWKQKTFAKGTYRLRSLLVPIFIDGKLVYDVPTLQEIRTYAKAEMDLLWDEIYRFEYPQIYYVDLTKKLLDLKLKMLGDIRHES